LQVASCKLQVASCKLQVTSYKHRCRLTPISTQPRPNLVPTSAQSRRRLARISMVHEPVSGRLARDERACIAAHIVRDNDSFMKW